LRIESIDPKFAGKYENAFAQLTSDGKVVLAFVRGCPQLTCEVVAADSGPSAGARGIAEMCPESGFATVILPSQKVQTFQADLEIGAPARKADITTLENVRIDITSIGHDRVTGSASSKTGGSSVDGHFAAIVCLSGGSAGHY
jgi:hypothetical protein